MIKRESGEIPEQTRYCKFYFKPSGHDKCHWLSKMAGKTVPEGEQVRRPAMRQIFQSSRGLDDEVKYAGKPLSCRGVYHLDKSGIRPTGILYPYDRLNVIEEITD